MKTSTSKTFHIAQIIKLNIEKVLLVLFLTGCSSQGDFSKSYDTFGETIDPDGAADIQMLPQLLHKNDSVSLKLAGKIEEVCQNKGCWMKLQNTDGTEIRVTFKDYGFFVPKDAAGKETVIEGNLTKTILSDEMARHYAEDAGVHYDSTQTYTEYSIVAKGVLIAKE